MIETASIIFWPGLFLLMSNINFHSDTKINHKLQVNTTSAINCYSSIFLGSLYYFTNYPFIRTLAITNSINYFIWDTFRIILHKNKSENVYIFHHILGLLMLEYAKNPLYSDFLFKSYITGETSNIFIYILYYLIKTRQLEYQKYIQGVHILWYGFFRIPWFFKELWYNKDDCPSVVYYPSIMLFTMGVKWWISQCVGYRKILSD